MTQSNKTRNHEQPLNINFRPAAVQVKDLTLRTDADGNIKINTKSGVNVDITNENISVSVGKPVIRAYADIVKPSQTNSTLDPANAMVKIGEVQMNKLSIYLAHFPDEAVADLLVAPKDTASIFNRGYGSWEDDIHDIRRIGDRQGLHYNGQVLRGMEIVDRPDYAPKQSYEQDWANTVIMTWAHAKATPHKAATTKLALGTLEIVRGRKINSNAITNPINLHSCLPDINAAFRAQNGQKIEDWRNSELSVYQYTATCSPGTSKPMCVNFMNGYDNPENFINGGISSRAIALHFPAIS